MAGLQRSAVSFRRQGSSGLVWDDKFLGGELNQLNQEEEAPGGGGGGGDKVGEEQRQREGNLDHQVVVKGSSSSTTAGSMDRSRSNGGRGHHRAGRVSPAVEPPSPKVSVCGFCGAFGKHEKTGRRPPVAGRRKM